MELIALGLAGSLVALLAWLFEFVTQRPGVERSVTTESITPRGRRTSGERFSKRSVTELRNHRLLDAEIEDHPKSFKPARDVAS